MCSKYTSKFASYAAVGFSLWPVALFSAAYSHLSKPLVGDSVVHAASKPQPLQFAAAKTATVTKAAWMHIEK
jgi:hypothetical protein